MEGGQRHQCCAHLPRRQIQTKNEINHKVHVVQISNLDQRMKQN